MERTTRLALLGFGLCLLLFPLAIVKPGLPFSLRADEGANYLAALSVVEDGDLQCESKDLARLFVEFPSGRGRQIALLSGTRSFGVSWLYPVVAAPAAALHGANGMNALNMALALLVAFLAIRHLGRHNPDAPSWLLGAGYVLASPVFVYAMRLQPEVLRVAAVAVALHLGLSSGGSEGDQDPDVAVSRWRRLLSSPRLRAVVSALALAAAVHERPYVALLALPIVLAAARRGAGAARAWVAAFAVGLALLVATGVWLTGRPLAHLDVARDHVTIDDPATPIFSEPEEGSVARRWDERLPATPSPQRVLVDNLAWASIGRHAGLLTQLPFVGIALLLFLRSPGRRGGGVLAAALGGVLALLVFLPLDWQGGGDLVGARYFLPLYPAFLYAVTRVAPLFLVPIGYALTGVLIGVMLFTPIGAPVINHADLAHARGPLARFLPYELHALERLPDHHSDGRVGVLIHGREDVVRFTNGIVEVHGGARTELLLETATPTDDVVFAVRSWAPDNVVELELGDDRQVLEFPGDPGEPGQRLEVTLRADDWRSLERLDGRVYFTRLTVRTRNGRVPHWVDNPGSGFYVGAWLGYLGSTEGFAAEQYAARWSDAVLPRQADPGQELSVRATVTNHSPVTWRARGPRRIVLEQQWWKDQERVGTVTRRRLEADVATDGEASFELTGAAPSEPGKYVLTIDLVAEGPGAVRVAFSERDVAARLGSTVQVGPPTPADDPEEP